MSVAAPVAVASLNAGSRASCSGRRTWRVCSCRALTTRVCIVFVIAWLFACTTIEQPIEASEFPGLQDRGRAGVEYSSGQHCAGTLSAGSRSRKCAVQTHSLSGAFTRGVLVKCKHPCQWLIERGGGAGWGVAIWWGAGRVSADTAVVGRTGGLGWGCYGAVMNRV